MFSGLLKEILSRTAGAEMALLVGTDGIIIDRAGQEKDADFDSLAAEFAVVLNKSKFTAADIGLGSLNELVTITDKAILVTKIVNEDFFVMMKMSSPENLGKARYEVHRAELLMEEIIES